jgi:hypothetical protein
MGDYFEGDDDDDESTGLEDDPEYQAARAEMLASEATERGTIAEMLQESEVQGRREFGAKCRRMRDLLAVHRLPHEFDDAKPWVRIWENEDDPTVDAAEWLDAGWIDHEVVGSLARGFTPGEVETELLRLGYSAEQIGSAKGGALLNDETIIEILESRLAAQK